MFFRYSLIMGIDEWIDVCAFLNRKQLLKLHFTCQYFADIISSNFTAKPFHVLKYFAVKRRNGKVVLYDQWYKKVVYEFEELADLGNFEVPLYIRINEFYIQAQDQSVKEFISANGLLPFQNALNGSQLIVFFDFSTFQTRQSLVSFMQRHLHAIFGACESVEIVGPLLPRIALDRNEPDCPLLSGLLFDIKKIKLDLGQSDGHCCNFEQVWKQSQLQSRDNVTEFDKSLARSAIAITFDLNEILRWIYRPLDIEKRSNQKESWERCKLTHQKSCGHRVIFVNTCAISMGQHQDDYIIRNLEVLKENFMKLSQKMESFQLEFTHTMDANLAKTYEFELRNAVGDYLSMTAEFEWPNWEKLFILRHFSHD